MAAGQMNRKVLIFDSFKKMSEFVLKKWGEVAESEVRRSGRFTVALSGGKTPIPFYNSLGDYGKNLPWEKTHIFLVDERILPHDDPESNFGMIKKTLFSKIDIPAVNIHPSYTDGTVHDAVEKYEEDIRNFFELKAGLLPQFDLIILGIGEDGHTASLFPDDEVLSENRRLVSAVSYPGVKFERISLTLPVINNAKTIIFLITGKNKAHIVNEIIEKGNTNLPAFLVKPISGELYYLIDKYAASEIDYKQGRNYV